jgi:hypothetical protein
MISFLFARYEYLQQTKLTRTRLSLSIRFLVLTDSGLKHVGATFQRG